MTYASTKGLFETVLNSLLAQLMIGTVTQNLSYSFVLV